MPILEHAILLDGDGDWTKVERLEKLDQGVRVRLVGTKDDVTFFYPWHRVSAIRTSPAQEA